VNKLVHVDRPLPISGKSVQDKLEESLPHDDLIAVLERLFIAGEQTWTTIDECPICATQVLNQKLIVEELNARVPSRDFCFRIILVEIDIREDSSISVPTAYQRFCTTEREFLTNFPAPLNDQFGVDI
jgi:hypothetical protein